MLIKSGLLGSLNAYFQKLWNKDDEISNELLMNGDCWNSILLNSDLKKKDLNSISGVSFLTQQQKRMKTNTHLIRSILGLN